MATIKRKSAAPLYAAAATWVLYAAFFPLYKPAHFILVAVVSFIVLIVMSAVCRPQKITVADKPKEEKPTGNEALDKMLKNGRLAVAEMKRLDDAIEDEKISADIVRLEALSEKIFEQVKANPEKLPEISRFMDYYLPTTLKLLNAYDRMGSQGVAGENITSTMQRVESMMGKIIAAFEKMLDGLFGADALDISTDISVLESMMAREGLADSDTQMHASAAQDSGDIKLEL